MPTPPIITEGPHKGKVPVPIRVNTNGKWQEQTLYFSVADWKAMEADKKHWCSCEKSQEGPFMMDGACTCGLFKNHKHCLVCHKLTYVG